MTIAIPVAVIAVISVIATAVQRHGPTDCMTTVDRDVRARECFHPCHAPATAFLGTTYPSAQHDVLVRAAGKKYGAPGCEP